MFIGTVNWEQRKHSEIIETSEDEAVAEMWTEILRIYGKEVTLKLDTGADCNAMSVKTFKALTNRGRLRASQSKLVAFFGHKIGPLGTTTLGESL